MKGSLEVFKRQISVLLAGLLFLSGPASADWVPPVGGTAGSGYQSVVSIDEAQARDRAAPDKTRERDLADESGVFGQTGGGNSSLLLTRPDNSQNPAPSLTSDEKERVELLLTEISKFIFDLGSGFHGQGDFVSSMTSSRPIEIRMEQQAEVVRNNSDDGAKAAENKPQDMAASREKIFVGGLQQDRFEIENDSKKKLIRNTSGGDANDPRVTLYQQGPVLFESQSLHESFLPEAVVETGVTVTTEDGLFVQNERLESGSAPENGIPFRVEVKTQKIAAIQWLIALLDKFEMSLGPQELEKTSASAAARDQAQAAEAGPAVTRGNPFSFQWMASLMGAAAEILRLSAEQLRDWLYEAEAFDQGSLEMKTRALRSAVQYLLMIGDLKGMNRESGVTGYRVVNAVNVDGELAALHILANPPRVHPFVRHVLFETQAVRLKRYWLDVEKLKALYAKAGTTDENGNSYFIRYRGQILDNPYRPMPDDMGGRYELVVAT